MGNNKVTIVSAGGPHQDTYESTAGLLKASHAARGDECAYWSLDDGEVESCLKCRLCQVVSHSRCGLKDLGQKIITSFFESDRLYLLVPVEVQRPGLESEKTAVDRLLFRFAYSQRHVQEHAPERLTRRGGPHLVVLGVLEERDEATERIFEIGIKGKSKCLAPQSTVIRFVYAKAQANESDATADEAA